MKIICIGRNYADHAKEMHAQAPSEPVFFFKPQTALSTGSQITIPNFTTNLHHEIELVFRVCKTGFTISESQALQYIDAWSLGIDFTARDIQDVLKAKGLPWEKAKAFDNSAFCAPFIDITDYILPDKEFALMCNSKYVQRGYLKEMLFAPAYLISYVSKFVTLQAGDLIFTGTPAGVGKVNAGDVLQGLYDSRIIFNITIN